MRDIITYQGEHLKIQIDIDSGIVTATFNILGYDLSIKDKSIRQICSKYLNDDNMMKKVAKRIHDNIVLDGLGVKQIKSTLDDLYAYKLWRFMR